MDALFQDVRYAIRSLLRAPGFALVAILTTGIGAGANATVFSFIDALLFRPAAAVDQPRSLVAVYTSDFSSGLYGESSYPDYVSLKETATAFAELAAYTDDPGAIVTIAGNTERISNSVVTADFFDVLGVRPVLGRLFESSDASSEAAPVAVIGEALWDRTYGRSATAIGSTISFRSRTYTVIGIAAPRFEGLDLARAREIWTLLPPPTAAAAERGNRSLNIVGRLARGISLEQAQAQLLSIADRLAAAYPSTNLGTLEHPDRPRPITAVWHTRIGPEFRSQVTMISGVIMTASLLVLLIACANVGNLLLARATARGREIAIRLAVGAGRRQIVRQLALESVLLGILGGIAGVFFALSTAGVLPSFFPDEQVRLLDAQVDGRVLAFCLIVSAAASLVFGLAPAVQSLRPAPAMVLRRDALTASESRAGARIRRSFVVVQVALAFVLLIGAGLLVRSLRNSFDADLGFATRNAVIVSIDLPPEFGAERGLAHYREALERGSALPGVEHVALSSAAPLSRGSRRGFFVDGYQRRPGEDMELPYNTITPGYFETMRIPLLAGRLFDDRDTASSRRVVLVNEVFARRYFGGNAVGRRVRDSAGTELDIVGVVRASALRSPQSPTPPVVYYPLAQTYSRSMRLIAATAVDPGSVLTTVFNELRGINRGVAVFRPTTMKAQIDEALAGDRLTASLVSACGLLALVLAMVGVYAVVAYSVALRKREIGVRIALGASAQHVSRLVLKEGLGLTLAGALLGGIVSPAATSAIGSMLYRVSPTDLTTFAAVSMLLCGITLLAAWIPMRRAVRVDPIGALRQD